MEMHLTPRTNRKQAPMPAAIMRDTPSISQIPEIEESIQENMFPLIEAPAADIPFSGMFDGRRQEQRYESREERGEEDRGENIFDRRDENRGEEMFERREGRMDLFNGDPKDISRDELMKKIMSANFAAHDLALYLNTHPKDRRAFEKFKEYGKKGRLLMNAYEEKYGPVALFLD